MGVKGSYRSVSQGYDNVPDIEIGAGDAVDAHVQRQMRLGFIRKVYGILTCQLALTTIVCSVLALNGACRRFVMTTPSLMYIGMFGSFGVLFALMAFKSQHPLNAQLLFVWTLMEAYTVGVVCASYTAAGQGRIVVEALVLTAAIFASLTLYTVYSKRTGASWKRACRLVCSSSFSGACSRCSSRRWRAGSTACSGPSSSVDSSSSTRGGSRSGSATTTTSWRASRSTSTSSISSSSS